MENITEARENRSKLWKEFDSGCCEEDNGDCCEGDCCCNNGKDSFDANIDYMEFQKKATRIEQARSNLAVLIGLIDVKKTLLLQKVIDSAIKNIEIMNEVESL